MKLHGTAGRATIPFDSAHSFSGQAGMLDVDKARLESAPGFDKDHWPDMANPEWAADIHDYYGRSMYSA